LRRTATALVQFPSQGASTPRILLPMRKLRTMIFCRKSLCSNGLANQLAFSVRFFDFPKGSKIPKNGSPIPNKLRWHQNFAGASVGYFGLLLFEKLM